jgi:hypothetical protein
MGQSESSSLSSTLEDVSLFQKKIETQKKNEEIPQIKQTVFEILENFSPEQHFENQNLQGYWLWRIQKSFGYDFYFAPEEIRNNELIAFTAIKSDQRSIFHIGEKLKNNKEFFEKILEEDIDLFFHAPDSIKNDERFAYEFVSRNWRNYDLVGDDLKKNEKFFEICFPLSPMLISFAPYSVKNDKDKIIECIKYSGFLLEYASEELQNDKEIVRMAVKSRGESLRFASKELCSNQEIVMEAIKNFGGSFYYASEELLNDENFIISILKDILDYGDFSTIKKSPFPGDKDFVLKAIDLDPRAYKLISYNLSDDLDIAMKAISKDGMLLDCCHESLKWNESLVKLAIQNNPRSIQFAPQSILKKNREICLEAVSKDGFCLGDVPEDFQHDKKFVLVAVSNCGKSLRFASEKLKNDEDIVMAAIKEDGKSLQFASHRLQNEKFLVILATDNGYKNYYPDNELLEDIEIFWKFTLGRHKLIRFLPGDLNFNFK